MAAMFALLLILAMRGSSPLPQEVVVDGAVLKKADKEPITSFQPIEKPVVEVPVAMPDQDGVWPGRPIPEKKVKAKEEESNLCTRHGMHKVFTNGGKSWRCRK